MFISQAQAAILSRNGLLQGANPSQHEVMLEKYGNMLRHLQGYVYITVFISLNNVRCNKAPFIELQSKLVGHLT